MADALSALSLLLAAFTVLFGLWQPMATAALSIPPMPHRLSRDDQVAQVWSALWRMIALLVVSLVVAGIFVPRAACIVVLAVAERGEYDDLRTAFVIAESLLAGLAVMVFLTVLRLRAWYKKLDSQETISEPKV